MRIQTGTQSMGIMGKSIKGIFFKFYIQHTTANTNFAAVPVLAEYVNVKVLIEDNAGRVINSANMNLRQLVSMSGFYDRGFGWAQRRFVNSAAVIADYRYVVAASAVDEVLMVPLVWEWPVTVAFTKGLRATVEVTISPSAYASTVDTASSYCEVQEIDADGNSPFIPVFQTLAVDGGSNNFQKPLGSWIHQIFWLNQDKTTKRESDQVIVSATLSSDKLSKTWDYQTLWADQERNFQLFGETNSGNAMSNNPAVLAQCFELFRSNGALLNSVNLSASLLTANVSSGQNFVTWISLVSNKQLFDRYLQVESEHQNENASWLTA